MEMRFNNIVSRWIIPFIAIIISLFLHALLFNIDWDDEEGNKKYSISVKLKKYEHKIKKKTVQKSDPKLNINNKTAITAIKLIQDTISFVKLRSKSTIKESKKRWQKDVTTISKSLTSNYISEYRGMNGTAHYKIAGNCFRYRETDHLRPFDEPIFEFERCNQ